MFVVFTGILSCSNSLDYLSMREYALEYFEYFLLDSFAPVVIDFSGYCNDRFDGMPERSFLVAPNGSILHMGSL